MPPSTHSATEPRLSETEQSSVIRQTPKLGGRGLTLLLALMCLIPVATIFWLWNTLPPVQPGTLEAEVRLEGVPPAVFYQQRYEDRPAIPGAMLIVKNSGPVPWTNFNIRINRHYQIYEHNFAIEPGNERGFLLDRFVTRTGATLDVRYTQIKHVQIYARLPDARRATFDQDIAPR